MEKTILQIAEEADLIDRLRKTDELKEDLAHMVSADTKVHQQYKWATAMIKNGDIEGYIGYLEKVKDIKELALIQNMNRRVTSLYTKGDMVAQTLAEAEHARKVRLGNAASSSE